MTRSRAVVVADGSHPIESEGLPSAAPVAKPFVTEIPSTTSVPLTATVRSSAPFGCEAAFSVDVVPAATSRSSTSADASVAIASERQTPQDRFIIPSRIIFDLL